MAAARLVSSSPGGHVGIRWRAGDIPRLLVTFSRACSIGLATVGVAGRPGGGAGGDSLGIESVDANGVASWHRCLMRVESSLNIVGVRVSSPAKNCLMSTVGVSSSLNSIASSLAVDFSVGPCKIFCPWLISPGVSGSPPPAYHSLGGKGRPQPISDGARHRKAVQGWQRPSLHSR